MSTKTARHLCIIRHGSTEHNASAVCSGQNAVGLSAVGECQARALGEALKPYNPSLVIGSDLPRAVQTLRIVNDALVVSSSIDHRLRERHYGSLDGSPLTEYHRLREESGLSRMEFRPEGGESYADVRARLAPFVEELWPISSRESVVIVGHEAINRIILSILVGGSPGDYPQSPACLNVIEVEACGRARLILSNSTRHLDALLDVG